jgi:hypothetical protein
MGVLAWSPIVADPPHKSDKPRAHDWLLVDAADPTYVDAVVSKLTHIMGVPSGRALLRRVYETGRSVTIGRPDPTDPPNAWVRPADLRAATAAGKPTGETSGRDEPVVGTGTGSDSIVAYEPADWPSPTDPASPVSDAMLFALLQEACRQIEGTAEPSLYRTGGQPLYETAEVGRYQSEHGRG